ncbi:MAG: RAMP superfamily CRISPR-associated protein, partial [Oscillospiraceae bacterium]
YFSANDLISKMTEKEHDRLYAILANGGALGKDLEPKINPEYIREVRRKLPILSILGAACYRYMLNGNCSVGFAMIRCSELGTGEQSADELVTEIGETRHIDRTAIDTDEQEMKPMPYITEAVIPGSVFDGSITFSPQATEVEKAAIYHGIKLINHLGGKSARGYGRVEITADQELDDSAYMAVYNTADIDFIKSFIAGT